MEDYKGYSDRELAFVRNNYLNLKSVNYFEEWVCYVKSVIEKDRDERARVVKTLCVDDNKSWRELSYECLKLWDIDEQGWPLKPRYNEIAGMAFCKVAAEILGEDYLKSPWFEWR